MARTESRFVVRESGEKSLRGCGEREGAEVEAGDDSERAAGADEKFVKVVAGDVFYNAATRFDLRAVAVDKFGAEEKITRGAISVAQWRVESGRDCATDGAV